MRVRETLPFEPPYNGCVYVRTERYKDGDLWVIEVDGDTSPESKLIDDLISKTVYEIFRKKNRDWDWDDIRAKHYSIRNEATYSNDGWHKVSYN